MHTTKSRLRALALGVCLLVTLALGGIAANAAETIDNDTLTVKVSNSSDEDFVKDAASANVQVDLYKIADAAPNGSYDIYDYTLVEGLEFTKTTSGETDWQQLAEDAEALALDGKIAKTLSSAQAISASEPYTTVFTGLQDGLYLVLAHGEEADSPALSATWEYTFAPSVVALPSKEADESGTIMTSFDYGEWLSEVAISLKPERLPRYGAIEIDKTVNEASAEDSSFVFHITGTTPQGEAYDNYAMVNIPAGETSGLVVVDHIPAGTKLTVVEDYAGRYKKGPVTVVDSDVVVADDADGTHNLIHFSCYNEKGDDTPGSHGVQNNFKYDNVGGDWTWTPSPKDRATNYGSTDNE